MMCAGPRTAANRPNFDRRLAPNLSEAKHLLMNHLNIEAPLIAAVNGPALIHAELALLCDVVLAAEHAAFQDMPHFRGGLVRATVCTWFFPC